MGYWPRLILFVTCAAFALLTAAVEMSREPDAPAPRIAAGG